VGRGGRCEDVCKGVPGAAMGDDLWRWAVVVEWWRAAEYNCLRLSFLGRNFNGV
jgi:hypothetical protein